MNKKRKKMIACFIVLAVLVILVAPVKHDQLENNSNSWTSLTFKIVNWCHTNYSENGGHTVYFDTKVYFFPQNFEDINKISEEYWNNYK